MQTTPRELPERAGPAGPALPGSAPAGQAGAATGGSLFVTFVGSVAWPPAFGLLQRVSGSYAVCFTAADALCAAAVLLASLAWRPDGGPAL
jgi:fucose permease